METLSKTNPEWLFISHQEFINPIIEEMYGYKSFLECFQTVYTRKEMLPVPKVKITVEGQEFPVEIRPLSVKHYDIVNENYKMAGGEYIENRLKHGAMIGAFAGDMLTGFAGIHMEGSSGMLEVLPSYRRMGIGSVLETSIINMQIEKGYIPYGQVGCENEKSMALQKKIGLYFSKEKVWWMKKQ